MRVKVVLFTAVSVALAAGVAPAHAAFPGQNGKLAFTSDRSGNYDIWTMSPNGRGLRNLTAGSSGSDDVANWSPDGRQIVFESTTVSATNPTGDQEVFVMNADGSGRRQITFNEHDDGVPSWSPDGQRIVFHRWFGDVDADLMTIRANGSGERNLTRSPGYWIGRACGRRMAARSRSATAATPAPAAATSTRSGQTARACAR